MHFEELYLDPENKESKKIFEMINSEAKRLEKNLKSVTDKEGKKAAIYSFYRKYYTMTLNKSLAQAGINRSPTRDIILDFPWKELNEDRFFCLKIWEKINH